MRHGSPSSVKNLSANGTSEQDGPARSPKHPTGQRILIVDDSPSIHEDFREILGAGSADGLDDLDELLFGPATTSVRPLSFDVDSALQGQQAVEMVRRANREGNPYSVCFLDIRMPPGWDGPETLVHLWDVEPEMQVVLCTAYSDYSWQELIDRLGHTDGLLILKKPFEVPEVRQLAHALVEKWRLARENRRRLDDLGARVAERTHALEQANRRLEEEMAERARMQGELERTRRLEALGRLVAGIGHEISNPLSLIAGNLELAQDSLRDMAGTISEAVHRELDDALRAVRVGSDRISHIVGDIRSFVHPSSAALEPVVVADAVEAAVVLIEHELDGHVELAVALDEVPPVLGHRVQVEHVLRNLLSNAAHALAATPRGAARIRVRAGRDGDHVVIVVADTGTGMDETVLHKIFDPFFTTKALGKGTGLGLYLCHGMVTAMGGTIAVSSASGRGTEVSVRLPVTSDDGEAERVERIPPATEARPEATDTAASRRTPRVLVIDDEPLIVHFMLRALSEYDVAGVSTGDEALRRCVDEDFDVVFCDLMMPGMNGMQLYEALEESRPEVLDKIVFVTGGASIDRARDFLAMVPNERLQKPVSLDRLRKQVDRLVDGGRPNSPRSPQP